MAKWIKPASNLIDATTAKIAKIFSLLIFVIMITTSIEVISRYVFNHPTMWVWPINKQLFGIFILFAGIYTMYRGDHIRVEILYDLFSPRLKSLARWIALVCFIIFIVALILQGTRMAWMSWVVKEKLSGAFKFPIYPFKILIPLTTLLFLLQGIVTFRRKKKKEN
jgi:TRAP-type mannitol/chloroaromatic compound transport system permease small subunit